MTIAAATRIASIVASVSDPRNPPELAPTLQAYLAGDAPLQPLAALINRSTWQWPAWEARRAIARQLYDGLPDDAISLDDVEKRIVALFRAADDLSLLFWCANERTTPHAERSVLLICDELRAHCARDQPAQRRVSVALGRPDQRLRARTRLRL